MHIRHGVCVRPGGGLRHTDGTRTRRRADENVLRMEVVESRDHKVARAPENGYGAIGRSGKMERLVV